MKKNFYFALVIAIVLGAIASLEATMSQPRSGRMVVTLHPSRRGALIHAALLGINEVAGLPVRTDPRILEAAGIRAGRFPGGSLADRYDWQSNTFCKSANPASEPFDAYMRDVAIPAHLDVEVTTNYGSSDQPLCDRPGTAARAAAWVRQANVVEKYGVHWWEIGNEVYGDYETDVHPIAHDATTYAAATGEFSRAMKAEDSSIAIGAVLNGYHTPWDPTVLRHGTYDYVVYHDYDVKPGDETDDILTRGPGAFRKNIAFIATELAAAGRPTTPISISEWNSAYSTPGKQTVSIVNGLYVGEIVAEMLSVGIRRAEFYNTFGCEYGGHGNSSPSLYGWQPPTLGSLGAFSEGIPFPATRPIVSGCQYVPASLESIPYGTALPAGDALSVYGRSGFVRDGERMIETTSGAGPGVSAYAATHGRNVIVMLFNTDPTHAASLSLAIDGVRSGSGFTFVRYGKAEYDRSRADGPFAGPSVGRGPAWRGSIAVTLPPWSMTAYTIATSAAHLAAPAPGPAVVPVPQSSAAAP